MNDSAERNVIGALFLDSASMDRVYGLLEADMFEDALMGRMYLEFQRAYDNNYQISPAVMVQKLSGCGIPAQAIMEAIKSSALNVVTGAVIKSDAMAVVNAWKARCLGKILNSVKVVPDGVETQING